MAVDTETKRRSTICLIPPLPVPDGTIGAADRAHVCWLYSAIAAKPWAAPVTLTLWDVPATQLAATDVALTALTLSDIGVTVVWVTQRDGSATILLVSDKANTLLSLTDKSV